MPLFNPTLVVMDWVCLKPQRVCFNKDGCGKYVIRNGVPCFANDVPLSQNDEQSEHYTVGGVIAGFTGSVRLGHVLIGLVKQG